MTVQDEEGEVLDEDSLSDNYPICEIYIVEAQKIEVSFALYEVAEGADWVYVAYVLASQGEIDDEARLEYIQTELEDWKTRAVDNGHEIIDSGVETLNSRQDTYELEYDLEPGYYECNASGGRFISDLDMSVYDQDEELLDEDSLADNYPMCAFTLEEPGTVLVQLLAYEFLGAAEEGYFCWCLSSGEPPEGMDQDQHVEWSGDEQELASKAEELAQEWVEGAEENNEEVIHVATASLHAEGEEEGWVYEVELSRGSYNFCAEGDGICLLDTDMVIYDEEGEVVESDTLDDNTPMCSLKVPRNGSTYRIVVYAYELPCGIGYFCFVASKE
jgi:hypothetical protein